MQSFPSPAHEKFLRDLVSSARVAIMQWSSLGLDLPELEYSLQIHRESSTLIIEASLKSFYITEDIKLTMSSTGIELHSSSSHPSAPDKFVK